MRDLVFGVVCIVTAKMSDRFSPRLVITLTAVLLGFGYLLMVGLSTPWQLYFFYSLIVACGMSGYVTILSIVAKWFEQRRGMMTAIALSGMGIGYMVMPPVVHHLIDAYGWRHAYLIMGIACCAIMFMAAQFLKAAPRWEGSSPEGDPDEATAEVRQPVDISLKEPHSFGSYRSCISFFSIPWSVSPFMSLYMQQGLAFPILWQQISRQLLADSVFWE